MVNPTTLKTEIPKIIELAKQIEGHLSDAEMEFLAVNAAVPTAEGCVLEIGSFKGKSTVILAKAASLASENSVVAVDPLTHDSLEAHDIHGTADADVFQHDFFTNLETYGVKDRVQFHQQFSYDMVETFDGTIRFLWVDGDHSYEGVKRDIALFTPFLADGAIVAMHDVLHNMDGPIRCFAEDILQSPHFGRAGVCGSIGWGQYHKDVTHTKAYETEKQILHKKINKLIPYALNHPELKGLTKVWYKIQRAMVPHGRIKLDEYIKMKP